MDAPTIITLVALIITIGAVIALMIVRRLEGKRDCSCGCGGCAMRDMCHSKDGAKKEEESSKEALTESEAFLTEEK